MTQEISNKIEELFIADWAIIPKEPKVKIQKLIDYQKIKEKNDKYSFHPEYYF